MSCHPATSPPGGEKLEIALIDWSVYPLTPKYQVENKIQISKILRN